MWLLGYNNRIRLEIDSTKIDSDLTNFPILLSLDTSSGIGSSDLSQYFTELGDNSKKVSLTTWNGVQCPIEIEQFDYTNKKAIFWAKVPKISSSVDLPLNFYYNPLVPDNTGYVGDIESSVGESIWDTNFVGVWHLCQSPIAANCVKDSTFNDLDCSPNNMDVTNLVNSKVGKGYDFNGTDEYSSILNASPLEITGNITLECIINSNCDQTTDREPVGREIDYVLNYGSTGAAKRGSFTVRSGSYFESGPVTMSSGEYHSFVGRYDGTYLRTYLDGSQASSNNIGAKVLDNHCRSFDIGTAGTFYFDGIIDEVRLSNIARSDAWLKATHNSNFDSLIKFKQFEKFNSNRKNNIIREIGGLSYGSRR